MLHQEDTSAFATRIAKLLERVEYRRADTVEEKEAIFRMRYEAYAREASIEANLSGLFSDSEDDTPNVWLIGVYIDGELASSVRLHVASKPQHYMPVTSAFPDIIIPRLASGDIFIDVTRQTSQLKFTRMFNFLPYITIRAVFLAADYFAVDYIASACRAEYQGAFRRMYGSTTWASPRSYPRLAKPQALTVCDVKAKRPGLDARYPFARSTPEEQFAMFGRSSTVDRDLYSELTAGRRERRPGGKQHSHTCAA